MTNKKIPIFGLILVIVGILFILNTLDIFYFTFTNFFRFFSPLLLIALGIWLIIRKKREEQQYHAEMHHHQNFTEPPKATSSSEQTRFSQPPGSEFVSPPPPPPPPPGSKIDFDGPRISAAPQMEPGRIRYNKVLGDMYIDCLNVNLQNIVVSMGVGDTEINLKGGLLSSGLNRMIITGFVGDIRIMIPNEMPVFIHSSCLIGNINLFGNNASGFSNDLDSQTANYSTSENKLYIAINHFIGDIKVFKI